jgi:hypothetical protein
LPFGKKIDTKENTGVVCGSLFLHRRNWNVKGWVYKPMTVDSQKSMNWIGPRTTALKKPQRTCQRTYYLEQLVLCLASYLWEKPTVSLNSKLCQKPEEQRKL